MAISIKDQFYMDTCFKAKKTQFINAAAHCTKFSKDKKTKKVDKEKIKNNLGIFMNLYKDMSDSTEYNVEKFDKNYTAGLDLGLWKDSNLNLSVLGEKLSNDEITSVYYISTVLINYINIIKDKPVNMLYEILNYLIENKTDILIKDSIKEITVFNIKEDIARNQQWKNVIFNILSDSIFFEQLDRSTLRFTREFCAKEIVFSLCKNSLERLSKIDNYKEKLKDQNIYSEYITKEWDELKEIYYRYVLKIKNNIKVNQEEKYDNQVVISDQALNRLVYGAPGTGKSNLLEKDRQVFGENYERVTFYEDYSYSQFFGTYKPYINKEGEITYKFVAGPFLRQLAKALSPKNSGQPQLLIIEEINRANAASVFGDMFQLLDRKSDGTGEYEVHISEEVQKYLKDEHNLETNTLRLPSNFYLWTTMNCADQGVFPLDSAFKRRFDEYKLMDINENEQEIEDIEIEIHCNNIGIIKWNVFRKAINQYLLEKGVKDDKLIGPFFIKPSVLIDTSKVQSAIKDKLLMYLLEDVVRRSKGLFHEKCKSLTAINSLYGKIFDGNYSSEIFAEDFIDYLNKYKSNNGDTNGNS